MKVTTPEKWNDVLRKCGYPPIKDILNCSKEEYSDFMLVNLVIAFRDEVNMKMKRAWEIQDKYEITGAGILHPWFFRVPPYLGACVSQGISCWQTCEAESDVMR